MVRTLSQDERRLILYALSALAAQQTSLASCLVCIDDARAEEFRAVARNAQTLSRTLGQAAELAAGDGETLSRCVTAVQERRAMRTRKAVA